MENNNESKLIEIDLKRTFYLVWHRLWIILLVGVLAGSLALGYAYFFVTPTYESSAQIYVNNKTTDSGAFSSSQLSAAQDLAYTYMVILESRNVLEDVAEKTGLGYSYGQLRGMIRTSTVNSTEVFKVVVKCSNYKHAAIIANAIADVLPEKIAAVVDGSSVRVVDYAVENPSKVDPSYRNYLFVGFLVGFAVCAVLVVVIDLLDTKINSEEYLIHVYGKIPLLAVIPSTEAPKGKGYKYRGSYKGYYESPSKKSAPQAPEQKNGGAQV